MKAGIMLDDFTPDSVVQPDLFDGSRIRSNSLQLMKVLDGINQSGKGSLWFARQGIDKEWAMKREMLSQSYMTSWSDIPVAYIR